MSAHSSPPAYEATPNPVLAVLQMLGPWHHREVTLQFLTGAEAGFEHSLSQYLTMKFAKEGLVTPCPYDPSDPPLDIAERHKVRGLALTDLGMKVAQVLLERERAEQK